MPPPEMLDNSMPPPEMLDNSGRMRRPICFARPNANWPPMASRSPQSEFVNRPGDPGGETASPSAYANCGCPRRRSQGFLQWGVTIRR
jgi:hypothetical protein